MTERPSQVPLFVYFIHDAASHAIKIGLAKDVERRLSILQIGNPNRLEVISTIPGDEKLEWLLHDAFAADRIRGEWFREDALLPVANDVRGHRVRCVDAALHGLPAPIQPFSDLAIERIRQARRRSADVREKQEQVRLAELEEAKRQAPGRRRASPARSETQVHLAQRIRERTARRRQR